MGWLGVLHFPDGRRGELLVEAKANIPELLGGAATECKAADVSRERIQKALERAAQAIGARPPSIEAWLGPLYQTANRLAHLYFLREVLNRPDAWLFHILFEDDTTFKPTTRAQWKQALSEVDTALGLPSPVPHAGHGACRSAPETSRAGGPTPAVLAVAVASADRIARDDELYGAAEALPFISVPIWTHKPLPFSDADG